MSILIYYCLLITFSGGMIGNVVMVCSYWLSSGVVSIRLAITITGISKTNKTFKYFFFLYCSRVSINLSIFLIKIIYSKKLTMINIVNVEKVAYIN